MHSGFKYNRTNTVAVFAQPRSGSTWFTDLLTAQPGTAKIDGPLFLGPFKPDGNMPPLMVAKLKSYHQLGFYYHQPIPENLEDPDVYTFFQRLFSHRFFTPYIYQETNLWRLPFSHRFVFKFYHANLMVPWLIKNFAIKPIVWFRNPFAVVSSQLNHAAFDLVKNVRTLQLPTFKYSGFFDDYRKVLTTMDTPEKILAAFWCLNYLPLVKDPANNRAWLTMSYEGLLMHKQEEKKRLFDYLGRSEPKAFESVFARMSHAGSGSISDPFQQLTKWQKELGQKQVEDIRRVLGLFEVEGYSASPEPDYRYIYQTSK